MSGWSSRRRTLGKAGCHPCRGLLALARTVALERQPENQLANSFHFDPIKTIAIRSLFGSAIIFLAKIPKWTNLVSRFISRLTAMSRPALKPFSTPPAATVEQMSAAGLRAFFNIARDWNLSTDEQLVLLGSPGRSTFFKWKASPQTARLTHDTLERLSLVLGIYKALQILLPQPAAAESWVKRPNDAAPFNGKRALDRMLAGNVSDLVAVRQYLDAARGGWA